MAAEGPPLNQGSYTEGQSPTSDVDSGSCKDIFIRVEILVTKGPLETGSQLQRRVSSEVPELGTFVASPPAAFYSLVSLNGQLKQSNFSTSSKSLGLYLCRKAVIYKFRFS